MFTIVKITTEECYFTNLYNSKVIFTVIKWYSKFKLFCHKTTQKMKKVLKCLFHQEIVNKIRRDMIDDFPYSFTLFIPQLNIQK